MPDDIDALVEALKSLLRPPAAPTAQPVRPDYGLSTATGISPVPERRQPASDQLLAEDPQRRAAQGRVADVADVADRATQALEALSMLAGGAKYAAGGKVSGGSPLPWSPKFGSQDSEPSAAGRPKNTPEQAEAYKARRALRAWGRREGFEGVGPYSAAQVDSLVAEVEAQGVGHDVARRLVAKAIKSYVPDSPAGESVAEQVVLRRSRQLEGIEKRKEEKAAQVHPEPTENELRRSAGIAQNARVAGAEATRLAKLEQLKADGMAYLRQQYPQRSAEQIQDLFEQNWHFWRRKVERGQGPMLPWQKR